MYKSKIPYQVLSNKQSLSTIAVEEPAVEHVAVEYCLYERKSSESDERQALSIDSQIKEMLAYSHPTRAIFAKPLGRSFRLGGFFLSYLLLPLLSC